MEENKTPKKITKVGEAANAATNSETATFVPTAESAGKAKQFRVISIILWVISFGLQIFGILKLRDVPINMPLLIGILVGMLVLVVIANILWKKANRLDPASEKNKTKFFIQSQLGLILSVLAFLPMVILIFTNKNMTGKQKGILGSIATGALVIAGLTGTDFNPPSKEQYAEQTAQVEDLNGGVNSVYWTPSGKSYHLFNSCGYINGKRTNEIFEGTVANARELKKITDLCDRCRNQAQKEKAKTLEVEMPAAE